MGLSSSDLINLAIAIIGSLWISRGQNALAIRQINREERLRVYAPLLAYLRARWVEFDISSRKQTSQPKRAYTPSDEESLKALETVIENYEFRARFDLLASNEIKSAVEAWRQNLAEATDLDDAVGFDEAMLFQGGKEDEALVASQRKERKKELRKRIENLMLELDNLEVSILSDLELSDSLKPKILRGHSWGTRARKRMKNGGK